MAYVWNDRLVNLSVVDQNGRQFSRTSVVLQQDEDMYGPGPGSEHCAWMPYQTGQAAKADPLKEYLDKVKNVHNKPLGPISPGIPAPLGLIPRRYDSAQQVKCEQPRDGLQRNDSNGYRYNY